ncbi:type III restriction-modification system endonuclease [Chryseobacterium sp. 5_R23647]|uniref:type III restriction-modification system endonuclease n=1 Tax=Chryseobacterium sp. 5_R23647 TaxID=2258964 RepID=UPI000E239E65|nr:type III restriction-modification system endonuclease [Chryseobacterium sp. 5_R23647]REC40001.1 type III restriction-modification system endonuclease [Chryseobacterium sp. 5_R23647]
MELILKNGLEHQVKGYNAIADALHDETFESNNLYYQNPTLVLDKDILNETVKEVQKKNKVHKEFMAQNSIEEYLNLDIKMETGTGKTYVYTAAIYDLHKRYKINKFIIVVPSLAIKAGTKQFIEDPYTKRHYRDVCGYGTEIDLLTLEAGKKKKGKQFFPSVVREFVSGSSQNKNKIYVILTNMSLLTGSNILTKDDYDYGVEGFYRPADALRSTKPFVIIDEPHRFTKTQKAWQFIEQELKPQSIIRFGATFPEITVGRGKNKITKKDYKNLLYDLNAYEAFNQNLIKGIAKEHFEPASKKEDKVKILSIESKSSAKFQFIEKDKPKKTFTLSKDDSLGLIAEELEGITIEAIGTNFVEFSNGQLKYQGEEFSTDIYSSSYQESMLRLAIDRHFEIERQNFDRKYKIKTLALFFIDDIYSYRQDSKSDKLPYLKETFEKLLIEKIDIVLAKLSDQEKEYRDFLLASKEDINATHAGYFSQDNSNSDEAIAQEIKEILFEKKKLLSLKNEDGSYNTRRFLFSKWTLKEGWDNPNVFTITKLRSSGSESSKIQEVGRGLRLPVDENGNRISNEEFKLNYIIDFTEADFATKLINEINKEIPAGYTISEEKLNEVSKRLSIDPDDLFTDLLIKKYIDRNRNVNLENSDKFFEEYPDFTIGLNSNKVQDRNKKVDKKIKIRKAVYDELKILWEAINHKYILYYDRVEDNDYLKTEIVHLLGKGVFADVYIKSKREQLNTDGGTVGIMEDTGVQYLVRKPIPYSDFLKRINRQTNIPIKLLNEALQEYGKTTTIHEDKINEHSVANFVREFSDWKNDNLQGRFSYSKSNLSSKATALTFADGSLREEITQGRIGTKFIEGTPTEKYLYDVYAFDSPLEKENLQVDNIDEIVVYGKIPRSSISIPTITGQSYSPDFMYVVKKENGEKVLNIIVETKDVENQSTLRGIEKAKIESAKVFFNQLSLNGYKVEFREQINNKKIKEIIDEVIYNE